MKYRVNDIAFDFSVDDGLPEDYKITTAEKEAVTKAVTSKIWEADDVYDLVEQISDKTGWLVDDYIDYEEVQ
jgi:hypothetical protein